MVGGPLALVAVGPGALPVKDAWMNELSFAPAPVAELYGYLDSHAKSSDPICGMPQFDWRLAPRWHVCDPFALGAAEGRAAGFYLPGAPASRLAWPCSLGHVRYAVVSRVHVLSLFKTTGVPLAFLEMERQGWPKVFDNGTFRLYENPAFGVQPSPGQSILTAPRVLPLRGRGRGQRRSARGRGLRHPARCGAEPGQPQTLTAMPWKIP